MLFLLIHNLINIFFLNNINVGNKNINKYKNDLSYALTPATPTHELNTYFYIHSSIDSPLIFI